MRKPLTAILFTLPTLLGGCASDAREEGGTSPMISDLELSPGASTVGGLETLRGTVRFEDPDADVLELHAALVEPSGSEADMPPVRVDGARGLMAGAVSLQLAVQFAMPGRHEVHVWLRDAEGNDSNPLVAAVDVSE